MIKEEPTIDWTKIIIAGIYFVMVFAVIIIGQLVPMQKVMESIYGEIVITLLAPIGTIIGFYFGTTMTRTTVKNMLKTLHNNH